MKILIAEDELPLANSLKKNFMEEGHQAIIALDGEEAISITTQNNFDVIVLDWRMPKLTGIDVLRQLKSSGNKTPIILLTALSRISNKVEALELGADDYLTKPFSFEELLARIKAVIRRSQPSSEIITLNGITLNLVTRKVNTSTRHEIKLRDKEFELLLYLIKNKGTIVSKEELCRCVWELNFVPPTNICESTVRNLRKKLEEATGRKFIKNVYGEGYTLIAD
ncbi:MAG: DNA-binding response regulator [Ignavibacteria bacterium RIFOXYB2_FULL_35_12]|nr:MAG: DNA-binding response regulator [Ignavibacteria bacterium GWA2_36_19]OGU49352.1 MAG: DNA-binding response regulator [Ignavibacteria bacterium GWC2_35_8]OGU61281.1 MAG: DNA-binding response regulator [Ignavibacteria bacterium GWF2_35_20]OGU81480.1 MAG: DNA-binding response regulator [Ignavibacteria bacterium RIFOXYA2_FULL_35_9]OGU84067.1 MAG: DNA-binding response regulator [Ignavibacteria bacterium RBG_16_35_7]OGU84117.1 MAG: DNA-binding response regulator [Ignavibacteria bacterium RIFOX